jgi:uncharacterized integral membrane protein
VIALRRILFVSLIFVAVAIAALFAFNNPERISVDIGVARLESVPASVAFVTAFALGWCFGIASATFALLRIAADRRRLRKELRFVEAEARSLRNLPLQDAD